MEMNSVVMGCQSQWTDEDMARYREHWPLGTEARLMLDILACTMLRVGDASRFGRRGCSGMEKLVSFDQNENIDEFMPLRSVKATVTSISNFCKKVQ